MDPKFDTGIVKNLDSSCQSQLPLHPENVSSLAISKKGNTRAIDTLINHFSHCHIYSHFLHPKYQKILSLLRNITLLSEQKQQLYFKRASLRYTTFAW